MNEHDLEILWDHLLSRDPTLVREAFQSLDPASQAEVLAHLQKMASEPGWHEQQKLSAEAALEALRE